MGDATLNTTGTLSALDDAHAAVFKQALARILSTEVAEYTYAEILDGLPTETSFLEFHFYQEGHPVFTQNHTSLCPGVLLAAFQRSYPGTQRFELRLMEMLAVTCHQIAVDLFNLDDGVHKHDVYEKWRDLPRDTILPGQHIAPVVFYHNAYFAHQQYPNGMGDVVGYWAEAKIFGGVVIFDRGPSGTEATPSLDGSDCPIPIHPTLNNKWRYDPWDSMTRFNIFRDRFERRPPPAGPKPCRGVKHAVDWPEIMDENAILVLQEEVSEGKPLDQARWDRAMEGLKSITPSSPHWVGEWRL
ncbi:hypothetical protein N0V88_000528 [Collariella sp. IMI 366227]|nr:hypothetical protein N0V88_000528 [Collariella sp. IMI 366227]